MRRTCQFYAIGGFIHDENNFWFLSYDEYDSKGSGLYFTNDLLMCNRYNLPEAEQIVYSKILDEKYYNIYLITIIKDEKEVIKYETEQSLFKTAIEIEEEMREQNENI